MSVLIDGMTIPKEGEYHMTLYVCSDGSAYVDVASFPVDEDRFKVFPAPPKKIGHWNSRVYYRESTKAYDCEMHVCSECGSEWSYDAETGSSDFNFCPNCGADMWEVDDGT